MSTIYDAVDPVELTATLRVLPEPENFLLDTFLPNVESQQMRFTIKELERSIRTASFRSYDAPVPLGKRPGFVKRQGELPALGKGYVLGEYARLLQEQLRGMDDAEIVGGVNQDARAGVLEIRARMELARGQVLGTGKFTLTDEEGLTLEADFGVPNDHMNVAPSGAAWTDHANADIVTDVTGWTTKTEDDSQERPAWMLPGRNVIPHVLANQKLRNQYGNMFGAATQLSIGQVNQLLDALDLPLFATADRNGRVQAIRPGQVLVDDVATNIYPADKVTLLPSTPIGETRWGPTVEALELAQEGRIALKDTPGVVAVAYKETNPAQITTVVNAVGLPLIERPKAMLVADPI